MRATATTGESTINRAPADMPQADIAGRRASLSQSDGAEARHRADSIPQARESQVSVGRYSYSPREPQAPRDRAPSDNFPDNESKHERGTDEGSFSAPLGRDPGDFDLDLDDEPELSSRQIAGTPMTFDQAVGAVQEHAALLVATLTQGEAGDHGQNDGSMYLLMSSAGKAFKQLLAHGTPFGEALAVFTKAAGDTFLALDSSDLGKVRDGLERLDFFAHDANRNVLHRVFATAIVQMRPVQLRRPALDEERARQQPPETAGGKAKQALLSAWRKTKRTGEAIDRQIGCAHRLERQSAEARAKARGAIDAALAKTMMVARAGGPARDTAIALNLIVLTSALQSADGETQEPSLDEFLTFSEDFLAAQGTGDLVGFAQALLDSAPSRPRADEKLDALGESLQALLAMRPGTQEVTRELRMTRLSGEQPAEVRDAFRKQRVAQALQSLARPDVTSNPNGSKFVAGVFIGLHRAIPAAEEQVFRERMQIGLREVTTEQLPQIRTNVEFAYPQMPIGRVTTVFEFVQRELRNRAMRLGDAELDAAPVAGAAASSQDRAPSRLMLEAVARSLALTLSNPPLDRPLDDAALIMSFVREAGAQVRNLMDAGATFQRAILTFGAAAHATFHAMDPHTLKRVIKGMERLDGLPVPAKGAIVQRGLVEALRKFDAEGVHRKTLDAARRNAPPPSGIAATLKGVGLKGWRTLKQTARGTEKAVAEPRAERQAAKSNEYRLAIFVAMDDAVASTLPGTVARDTSLRVQLDRLMRAANFEGALIDDGEGKRFLALAEDFLLVLKTDVLVGFAQELMRTAPTRPASDIRLDRLGMSLAEVLEMRPDTAGVVAALRQHGRVTGPVSPAVLASPAAVTAG